MDVVMFVITMSFSSAQSYLVELYHRQFKVQVCVSWTSYRRTTGGQLSMGFNFIVYQLKFIIQTTFLAIKFCSQYNFFLNIQSFYCINSCCLPGYGILVRLFLIWPTIAILRFSRSKKHMRDAIYAFGMDNSIWNMFLSQIQAANFLKFMHFCFVIFF